MPHYKSLLDTTHLGQWDLQDPKTDRFREATVEIASVKRYATPRPKINRKTGKVEPNKTLEIGFVNKRKTWLSKPATQEAIVGMYGTNIKNWIGKRITLYVDETVKFGRQVTGGIRVRVMVPKDAPTTDPLDNEVDEETARAIAEARDEFFEDAIEEMAAEGGAK